jgi:glycosyltransferase involved in cell wall biosynthesis
MKVLFLPNNIASIPFITSEALNRIPGVEAKCITQFLSKYQTVNENVIYLPKEWVSKRNPVKWLWKEYRYRREIKKWIRWADVLHYVGSPVFENGLDLQWAKQLKKPVFIEWLGSDIRNPDYLRKINPFYDQVFENGYEYGSYESKSRSDKTQQLFANFAAMPLTTPEMSLFISRNYFKDIQWLYQRIDLSAIRANFPDVKTGKPLIIHSPTARVAKGSDYIHKVIEELKGDYDFEFKLIQNMTREEVLKYTAQADIFLDQIICGGYGMAATEAMALGKPVMCFLLPEVYTAGLPENCPIVNTNPDNLKENLIQLLESPELRYEIGKKSRAFAEAYHDASKVAASLVSIYSKSLKGAL